MYTTKLHKAANSMKAGTMLSLLVFIFLTIVYAESSPCQAHNKTIHICG